MKETSAHTRIIQMVAQTGKFREHAIARNWAAAGVVALALIFKFALLCLDVYPFNADEAIVALMARHTLNGEWPIFFYGQAYMGSLDATLVAAGFKLFGQQIWVIRLVQSVLFVGVLLTSMRLSTKLSKGSIPSLITGLLLAVPTVNLNLYTTVSLGGYGEALLLGNLILLLSMAIRERGHSCWLHFLWGLSAGVGFWAFGLTLIYIIPAGIFVIYSRKAEGSRRSLKKGLTWMVLGVLVGAAPIWYWMSMHDPSTLVAELLGSAVAGTSASGYWSTVSNHLFSFVIFGLTAAFGLRAPWSTEIFFEPLAIGLAFFWAAVFIQFVRSLRGKSGSPAVARLLGGAVLVLIVGFILTPFGGDPSGRYFLPLTIMAAISAGLLFSHSNEWFPRWVAWALFAMAFTYQLAANFQVALHSPSGFSTQFDPIARIDHGADEALIEFLEEQGETRGYTNYWVAYPLAFKSNEQLIFIPRLPYHLDFRYTSRDNRYDPYNSLVDQSGRQAYITTKHPEMDELIRMRFSALDVTWREERIGDFQIFYDLSRPVLPEDIDTRFQR
ncbi:MAG: hypothetical protein P1P76_11945 [Anaerolineales bacterium]|nr:hypothetical protein [Anaerolineales bacterium]